MISRRAMARNFVETLGSAPTSKLVQALAAELILAHRSSQTDLVMADIASELLALRGELHGTVTGAHALSAGLHKELVTEIQRLTGAKDVTLAEQTDPDLIGGVVIDTPDSRYDWSVKHKLDSLEGVK